MGDRRKNKGKASRAGRADTGDFSSYIGAQSTSAASDPRRFHVDPQQFIEHHAIHEKLDTATINRDSKSDRFVTLHSLQKIWDWKLLTQFLAILGYEDNAALLESVQTYLLKTLSILVAIRWDKWSTFGEIFLEYRDGGWVRHDRKDDELPYSLNELEDDSFLGRLWASAFLSTQYTYIPIFLTERGKDDEDDKDEIYPRTRPLPFIRSETRLIARGGYGTVTKEVIACHQFRPKTNYHRGSIVYPAELPVARKRFEGRGDFKKEARNLASLNSSLSDHDRIVKYMAVFTIEDEDDIYAAKEFNILLPLADADLHQFLYNKRFEKRFGSIVDLLQEASNVADAIQWLHAGRSINGSILVCCHMDIKLDNILVYLDCPSPVGWWKISDFGISSMMEREDEQTVFRRSPSTLLTVPPAESLAIIKGTAKTSAKRAAGAYSAPEVEGDNQVGRPSDIWSFGCILFQVLARAAGGIQLLQALDDKRASFENGSTNDHFCQRSIRGKTLHPSVRQWLESKDSLPHGSYPDRSRVMNCKDLILSTLSIDPKARIGAEELRDKLVDIARGGGRQYLFDHDSNLVPAPPTPQRSRRKPPPTATTHNRTTRSVPKTPEKTRLESTEAQYLSMNKPTSPPFSPLPTSHIPMVTQAPLLTLQPPPTPPLDTDDRSPMPGHQLNHDGDPGPSILNQFPTRKPLASPLQRAERELDPSPSSQAEYSSGSALTSSPLPFRSPTTSFPRATSQGSFPRQRSRNDSWKTSVSSVPDVQAPRSEITGEIIPFQAPQHVISTLISSTRAKIAFIAPGATVVYTLYSPYSKRTILPPQNYAWQKGSLAGNYLALHSASDKYSTQELHLYKLSINDRELDYQEIRSEIKFPHFEKFAISRDGRLLLGSSNTVWLYPSFDAAGEELRIGTGSTKGGKLQRVWFSTNGLRAFAWISFPGNMHHVKIWDVADTTKTGGLNHQISASDMTASAVRNMVHFPKSPLCIIWKQHDNISLLQHLTSPKVQQVANSPHLPNLQAIAVTPNEEAVVFIRQFKNVTRKGLKLTSKISVGRIERKGDYRMLGNISDNEDLQFYLDKPDKCDVVIEEHTSTNTTVRVLIAHHNGNFEVKEVNLPT